MAVFYLKVCGNMSYSNKCKTKILIYAFGDFSRVYFG